jgi:PAS domain S-box-containing protein/diguanylate cyclase (GGDEF)-like protein
MGEVSLRGDLLTRLYPPPHEGSGTMFVASVDRVFPLRVLGTVTLGAVLVLAAAVANAFATPMAVALAGGSAAALPAVALVSRGIAINIAARRGRVPRGSCRCTGMLGLGVLTGGLTLAALPYTSAAQRPLLMTGGLTAAAMLFTTGLLSVPGAASTLLGRLRHALDGLLIGLSLALVGWLLMPQIGTAYPLGYVAAVVAATYASVTVAALLRTPRQRQAFARCGTGTMLAIIGMAMLVMSGPPASSQVVMLAAAVLVVAAPPLIWAGARRVDLSMPLAEPASLDETFGGYPVLALPLGAVALAFAYHVGFVGLPDRTAVLLGVMLGAAMAVREILAATDLRRYARRLATQQARLRALVAGTSDVTMVLDEDLVVRWLSPAAAHQFGLAGPELVGRALTDRIHPDDLPAFVDQLWQVTATGERNRYDGPLLVEARMLDGAGRWRETESTISDLRAIPEVRALVAQVRDVGQRRDLERAVRRLTSTDLVTGLANRRELLRAITARRGAGHRSGALIVIDLYGIEPGTDALLVEAAERLRAQVGADDVPCRLGESEFAVVTADGPIEAYAMAVRLLAALTAPYQLAGRPKLLQTSAGLAGLSGGDSAFEVLRRGSMALRQASALGRNRIEWYDESLEEQLVRRLDLERHLPGAAGRDELDLVYQPVVELDSGRPIGVEALLRWRHPVLGTVPPAELLPIADKLRVSTEIAEWVLHHACRQVAAWRREGHDIRLGVNVSARQLLDQDFVPEVAAALSVHQTPPERLVVEISDLAVADRLPEVAGQLSKLRALGVRTALDDFGAGDTDLSRLRRLPLDAVKLACSSIAGSAGDLAAAVVDLTGRLGLTVVADGLETEAQRDLVRDAGCRYGQGRVMVPPAPAERIEAYLETQRATSH